LGAGSKQGRLECFRPVRSPAQELFAGGSLQRWFRVLPLRFHRSYKEGEAWRNSTSFGRNNLLVLSLLAMRAFEWITSLPKTGQRRA
jgi:hypothetical protein